MAIRADTETRRDQILAAAERLFRQRGYLATSVRDIGEAVGINGASLYSHIGSKEDLLWEIASRAADAFFAALEPIARADEPIPLRLRKAIIAHVGVITQHRDAAGVYFNEWRHLDEPRRSAFAKRMDDYQAIFRGMLREGIQAGLFAPVDERFASLVVLSALNWTHQWYRPDGAMTPEEIGRHLADLLFNGLYRPGL